MAVGKPVHWEQGGFPSRPAPKSYFFHVAPQGSPLPPPPQSKALSAVVQGARHFPGGSALLGARGPTWSEPPLGSAAERLQGGGALLFPGGWLFLASLAT